MYWFLLFLGVAVVWAIVLALLARRLWGQGRALARELAAAQSKLEAAQRVPTSSSGHSEQDAGARA
jgi:Na+-transporting methylmalonyl-CoA/oxaloacetate decarboxylase gamma subunit